MSEGSIERSKQLADEALRLHRAGQVDLALPLYKQALELNPQLSYAYTSLGVALRAQGNSRAAVACYRRALEFEHENPVIFSKAGLHWTYGLSSHEASMMVNPIGAELIA